MKHRFSRRYQAALLGYLRRGSASGLNSAQGMGQEALNVGLQTLDLAKLHEQILVSEVLPCCMASKRTALIKQAGAFFAVAITPLEKAHRSFRENTAELKKIVEMLSQRTVELAASNLELSLEITQRKAAEEALKKSEHHYSQLLEKSERLQEELRRLSRQVLSAQEEERRVISRELYDVIAQTLIGINVRLAALKKEAALNTKGLDRHIARTQRLVEKSVDIVHRFARELRPAVLDDLGLIPALHSYMKNFASADGRARAFDSVCSGGTIGRGQTDGALSRRPGSADQCRPPCQSQPGGSEHPETDRHRRAWKSRTTASPFKWKAEIARQREQTIADCSA